MFLQVASGLCITLIQESADIPSIPRFASGSCTLKNVASTALVLILNPWGVSKEDIDW